MADLPINDRAKIIHRGEPTSSGDDAIFCTANVPADMRKKMIQMLRDSAIPSQSPIDVTPTSVKSYPLDDSLNSPLIEDRK